MSHFLKDRLTQINLYDQYLDVLRLDYLLIIYFLWSFETIYFKNFTSELFANVSFFL